MPNGFALDEPQKCICREGSVLDARGRDCRKLIQHELRGLPETDQRLVLKQVAFVGLKDSQGQRLLALPVFEGEISNIRVRNVNFCRNFWNDMESIPGPN